MITPQQASTILRNTGANLEELASNLEDQAQELYSLAAALDPPMPPAPGTVGALLSPPDAIARLAAEIAAQSYVVERLFASRDSPTGSAVVYDVEP